MKFSVVAAATASLILTPLRVLASPVPDAAPVAVPEGIKARRELPVPPSVKDNQGQSDADLQTRELFDRNPLQYKALCKIVNVQDHAYCRSGPGTNYPVEYWPQKGHEYAFACYKKGTCIDGNW